MSNHLVVQSCSGRTGWRCNVDRDLTAMIVCMTSVGKYLVFLLNLDLRHRPLVCKTGGKLCSNCLCEENANNIKIVVKVTN